MKEKYDIVIVGAGPAGSLTAKTAAERGADVLLIDRKKEIGVPVICAEGVSKEIEKLVRVDKDWVSAEIKGANIYSSNGSKMTLIFGGEVAGYILNRKKFDRFLAVQAAEAGAAVETETRAYGLIDGKGVRVRHKGKDIRIFADIIVGADGVESQVGRWAGIDTQLQLSDIGVCAEFFMKDIEINRNFCEFFLGDVAPKGYVWIFPKGENCANVGVGISADIQRKGQRAIDYLNAFVKDKFPKGRVVTKIYGAVPSSGPVYETVTDSTILVGDAAKQIDPLSGGGILYAMKAGKIAGEVIAEAVLERNFSRERLMEYENRWRKEFGKELKIGLKAKEFFFGLSNEDINKIISSLGEIEMKTKDITTLTLLKKVIKRNPKLLFNLAKTIF